jgi:hypothetical protein
LGQDVWGERDLSGPGCSAKRERRLTCPRPWSSFLPSPLRAKTFSATMPPVSSVVVACAECSRESMAEQDADERLTYPAGWQQRSTLPSEPPRFICSLCVLRETLKATKT